jgi:hypothetical protein
METLFAKAADEHVLVKLLDVYQQRMHALQKELDPLLKERHRFDHLQQLICADMRLVAAQRDAWKQQWQRWNEEGGTLRHGRSYNARHQQLADMEKLLAVHLEKLEAKRAEIRKKISLQHRLIFRQKQKMECVKDWIERDRREKSGVVQRRETGADEERVLAQWFVMGAGIRS